ncbi:ERp60 [Trypoxylus dichotomus]
MTRINVILYQKFVICTLLTFIFIFARKHGQKFYAKDLTEMNFNKTLYENVFVLIVYYTSGCEPCEKFLPNFEYAGSRAIKNDPPILFAKVNCGKSFSKRLCHDITGIPTMKFYKYGRYADEFPFKERATMAKYAAKFVNPDVEEILSKNHYVQYLDSTSYAVIGLFAKPCELKEAYLNVTNLMYARFDYAQSSEREVLNYQNVRRGIVVYKPDYMRNSFEEDFSVYNSEPDLDKIKDFIIKSFHGLAGFRRPENKNDFTPPLLTVFYDFDFKHSIGKSKIVRNTLLSVASKYRNRLNFAISRSGDWSGLLKKFGIENVDGRLGKPITTALDVYERKYIMEEEYSEESLDKFVRKLIDRSLKPFVKSGRIRGKNDSLIMELTARNLEDVAFNNSIDVLLYVYNPSCNVCHVMYKAIDNLAEELKDESILICQIDGIANDLPKLVKPIGYPTIFYLQKNRKHKPVMFFGGPNFHDLIIFVTRYSTDDLRRFNRMGQVRKAEKDEL